MARIRTVKPDFFTSEQVVECSTTARLLFIGMWCFCDDAGIHPASYKTLQMQVFPGDGFKIDQIKSMVAELLGNNLLVEYEIDGKIYWKVTGWKHQKIDKPHYKYPDLKDSTTIRLPISERSPAEGKGREGKVMEGSITPLQKFKNSDLSEMNEWFLLNAPSVNKELLKDKILDWCAAKGKPYKDYFAATRTWAKDEHGKNVAKGWTKPKTPVNRNDPYAHLTGGSNA